MKDMEAVRYNERLKLRSQTIMAAGAALSAWAAVASWQAQTLATPTAVWLLLGLITMYVATALLGMLQPEE